MTKRMGTTNTRKLRPTGRKRRITTYAKQSQVSRIPRSYFNPLPTTFRVALKLNYDELQAIDFNSGKSYQAGYFSGFMPIRYIGLTNSKTAGGLLALMSIYGKVAVLKTHYHFTFINQTESANQNFELATAIMPYYDAAVRYSNASTLSDNDFDALRNIPGSRFYQVTETRGGKAWAIDNQLVDNQKWLGQPLDARHCTFTREGAVTTVLSYPKLSDPTVACLPVYVWATKASPSASAQTYFRVNVQVTFHCEFSGLRTLVSEPDDIKTWQVSEQP